MKIKKFRAANQSAAMAMIRREMGPDAVILSARPVNVPTNTGDRVEITAAVDWDKTRPEPSAEPHAPSLTSSPSGREAVPTESASSEAQMDLSRISDQIRELQRMMKQLANKVPAPDELALEELFRSVYGEMVANDVEPSLAMRVVRAVRQRYSSPSGRIQVADACHTALKSLLPNDAPSSKRVIALVGPTGVGKTTTAAKLAATAIVRGRGPIALVTIDTYRVAAVEQLRAYAGAMGAHFEVAHDVKELDQALGRCQKATGIILDTEGRGQRDLRCLKPLFQYLSRRTDIEKHLVMSATTKPIDMQETVERFQHASPDRLIFTKIDETGSYGPIISESVRSGLPVSYLGTGQKVPEELLAATPEKLAELALSSIG